jgi:hypothetical protein
MAKAVPPPSYLEYVHSLSGQWPRLRLLEDFANRDNKILDYHGDAEVDLRMNALDVNVIGFGPGSNETRYFNDIDELTFHLDNKPPSLQLRIFSRETLCGCYRIARREIFSRPSLFREPFAGNRNLFRGSMDG